MIPATGTKTTDTPLLRAEGIVKRFGGTKALDNVRIDIRAGEVHALMGENGAGKSTLGKILSGIYGMDSGQLYMDENPIHLTGIRQASEYGISIVLQEFNLINDLSVAENLFLKDASYYKKGFLVDYKKMVADSHDLLQLFGVECNVNPRELVKKLSVAEMQILEILKAVKNESRILILDEPTAALTKVEASRLFQIVKNLRGKGVGIVIVSHRIEEIYEIADKVTVLRDGRMVLEARDLKTLAQGDLVSVMVGREMRDLYGTQKKRELANSPVVLEAKNLNDLHGRVKNVNLKLKKGEILGLAGLVGAGRTELARCLFGADASKGEIRVNGKRITKPSIRKSIRHRMAMVPEDRKHDGLLLNLDVMKNISLAKIAKDRNLILSGKTESDDCAEMTKKMRIKSNDPRVPVSSLSGGNQQKVLLSKWLLIRPDILIVDEPTRGIDISAKGEIYAILNNLADEGVAVLMISSEMPEVLGLADRILVMKEGEIVMELAREDATEEAIAYGAMVGTTGFSRP